MTQTLAPRTPETEAPVDARTSERVAAAAGPLFVVCILAGNSLTESVSTGKDGAAGAAADLLAMSTSTAARAGLVLELTGLTLLLVFAGAVVARGLGLRRLLPASVAAVAAAVMVGTKLASASDVLAGLALTSALPDSTLQALVEANAAAFVVGWIPFGLLVTAAAISLAESPLGRPTVWFGVVVGVGSVALGMTGAVWPGLAVPLPFLLGVLWTGVVGARLALGR